MIPPTNDQLASFGLVLRSMREGAGLPLREAARRAGISHTTLTRFERGERQVQIETLARLTRVIADEVAAKRGDAA